MRISFERPWKSIVEPPIQAELPSFAILIGPNGAGKSQLVDAIEAGALRVDGFPDPANLARDDVRVFRLSELMAKVEQPRVMNDFRESWAGVAQHIRQMVDTNQQERHSNPENLQNTILANIRQNRMLSEGALRQLLGYRNKLLVDYTLQEIRDGLPLVSSELDPFQLSIAEVFGTYYSRRDENRKQEFYAHTGRDHAPFISEEEFILRYGEPPWDVLNSALSAIGLEYEFATPSIAGDSIPFVPELTHKTGNVALSVQDLSSGEKTLLAVALGLYTGSGMASDYLQLPKVLLLDEPDASLHPGMISGLLQVLRTVFVETHGVRVIITTHSPTTVALASESALFAIRRGSGQRISKVTKDAAISALAVGIPTLSVRVEHRKTVIVEERNDVKWLEGFYGAVRPNLTGPFSLQFIPSGSGSSEYPENSGSAAEVKRLVKALRDSGNDRVFGIVDHDNRNHGNETVHVAKQRYAIENYVLDPALVGAFLISQSHVDPVEFGLEPNRLHYKVDQRDVELIVQNIAARLGFGEEAVQPVSYVGGITVDMPQSFLRLNGHKLEDRYKQGIPQLRAYADVCSKVVQFAVRDCPHLVPSAIVDLFDGISN